MNPTPQLDKMVAVTYQYSHSEDSNKWYPSLVLFSSASDAYSFLDKLEKGKRPYKNVTCFYPHGALSKKWEHQREYQDYRTPGECDKPGWPWRIRQPKPTGPKPPLKK